jgi:hypothetical protein
MGRRKVSGQPGTSGPADWQAGAARCRHAGPGWRLGQVSAERTASRIILGRHARGLPDLAAVSAEQTQQKNMTIPLTR